MVDFLYDFRLNRARGATRLLGSEVSPSLGVGVAAPESGRTFSPELSAFRAAFDRAKARIQNGEFQKAVPFLVWRSPDPPTPEELSDWVARAAAHAHLGRPYAFWDGRRGTLGVTPELLFDYQNEGRILRTHALAGTVARPEDWNSKLKVEHELVVEGLVSRLQNFGGKPEVGPFGFRSFGTLWHGQTLITLTEAEGDPDTWVRRLHPTAALGLFPPAGPEACAFLGERDYFGAPFGEIDARGCRAWVQIRGLEWNAHEVRVSCGVGVTAQSVFEGELAEATAKFSSIEKIFGLGRWGGPSG